MANAVLHATTSNEFKLLDVASGMGEPAKTIALAFPQSTVVASDVSEDMIAKAKLALQDIPNATPLLADAADLSSISSDSMDVVTCCYGYMFPENKLAALAESFRVLKPNGTLIATTWDKLVMLDIVNDVMEVCLGSRPPPPPLNPMSLSEEGLFESMVVNAGFKNVETVKSTYPFDFGDDREFQLKCGLILVKQKIEELGMEDVAEKAFFDNIGKYVTFEDGNMILKENTFQMLTASK